MSHIKSDQPVNESDYEYVGFWIRAGAFLIDSILILIIIGPILTVIYGEQYWSSEVLLKGYWDLILNLILPAIAIVLFWTYRQATPGKMVFRARIVDERTGNVPKLKQWIIRYIGYYLSGIALGLGFIWVGWDRKKQGWHDKLAGTVVIRPKNKGVEPVSFRRKGGISENTTIDQKIIGTGDEDMQHISYLKNIKNTLESPTWEAKPPINGFVLLRYLLVSAAILTVAAIIRAGFIQQKYYDTQILDLTYSDFFVDLIGNLIASFIYLFPCLAMISLIKTPPPPNARGRQAISLLGGYIFLFITILFALILLSLPLEFADGWGFFVFFVIQTLVVLLISILYGIAAFVAYLTHPK